MKRKLYLLLIRPLQHTYQKLRYGVSDRDCWSMDDTISKSIYKKILFFRNFQEMKGVGAPCQFETMDQWLRELDYMVYFWQVKADMWSENADELEKTFRFRRGFVSFIKYYHSLWD